jgi:hypothetical protein
MQRFSADRRYATLTAFVIERQAALTDLAIDLFGKLLSVARRKADFSRNERRLREADIPGARRCAVCFCIAAGLPVRGTQ